jgi:phospholipid/cholesterol/gamma-HCH transport system substrate-binding protein
MTRRAVELILGVVLVGALAAAMVSITVIGEFNPLEAPNSVYVHFDDAHFLSPGNVVRSSGLMVGHVEEVTLADDGVVAQLVLRRGIEVHEGYSVQIRPLSILGGQFIEVDIGDPEGAIARSSLAKPLSGKPEADLFKTVGQTIDEAVPHLTSAVANIREAMEKVENAQGTLGLFFADDHNELRENLDTVFQRFETTTRLLNNTSDKVEQGTGTLGRLFNEPRFQDSLSEASERIGSIADKVESGAGPVGALLNDDELVDTLSTVRERLGDDLEKILETFGAGPEDGPAAEMREHMSAALKNLDAVLEKVREGRGPIFVLLADPDTDAALERARAHLEAFANRSGNSTADRVLGDRKLVTDVEAAYLDYREVYGDVSDWNPISGTVEGFFRTKVGPAPYTRPIQAHLYPNAPTAR